MILAINDSTTIADLQEKFNECFPHLKIGFYAHPHHWNEPSVQNEVIDPSKKIGEVRNKHEHGMLEIKSWYQTGRVEQDFKTLYGLNVQISRNEKGQGRETVTGDKTYTQRATTINFCIDR